MEKMNRQICVDAGSDYCPCHLATTGDCVLCPMMQGKEFCDCLWQGVCIYNNFIHNNNIINEERTDILCDILDKKQIGENLYQLDIKLPKKLCMDLINPGSYVLLRAEDKNDGKFNTPISVMNVDTSRDILTVVVKTVGVKTKNIINHDKVWIRGPFRNGVFGLKYLKLTKDSNTVVVSKGLSQVTIVKTIKQLLKNNNHVEVFIDNYKNPVEDVVKLVESMGVNIQFIDFEKDSNMIEDYIRRNDVKLVVSASFNNFNKRVMEIVDKVDEDIRLVITNNNLISCGEGICGACTVKINGQRLKSCKAQIEPRYFLREVVK